MIILIATCSLIAFLNYLVDPLWCFSHANFLNSKQLAFDERQEKSDYLVQRQLKYDALLLGSSRTNIIEQQDIVGYSAFNFAVNAMMPEEYAAYAGFAKKHNPQQFKLLLLGVDFFGSNANFKGYGQKKPDHYFKNAEDPLFRYKMLLTWDVCFYSARNVRQLFAPTTHIFYDRNNHKKVLPVSAKYKAIQIAHDMAEFKRYLYGSTYQFTDIRPQLKKLRDENSSCRFIVFTTPDSLPLWRYLLQAGRLEDYLRWLSGLVDVFGEVYDFMGENQLTSNMENFQDAHHLTPLAAHKMVNRMLMGSSGSTQGFGTLVTRGNFTEYARRVRARYVNSRN